MKRTILLLVVLLITAGAAPTAAAHGGSHSGEAFAGTHVSFETEANAISGYAVGGNTLFENVSVGSASDGGVGLDTDLSASAITSINAAGLSVDSESNARISLTTDSGAEMESHDNSRGHLIIKAGDSDQQVIAELDSESAAESEGDRVVVTTANGTTATALVVGDGEVAVNDNGDLSADLNSGAELVIRSNGEERDDNDREQESMIESGTATAELHVMSRDGERVDDVVAYGQDTSVETSQQAESNVELTVDRTSSEGTVVLTTVSESVLNTANDLSVAVDGEAAAQASSYSELESAAAGDSGSAYLVSESSAEASADVLVAIDHFSERTVTMESTDDSTADDSTMDDESTGGADDDGESTDDGTDVSAPGFGIGVALVALLSVAAAVGRRE
jgi:PGF-CTERM protein